MIDNRTELPIACSLEAAELGDRRGIWESLSERALRELRPTTEGVRLVYAASEKVEAQLRELARLEAECCSFADWRVRRSGDELIVDVTAAGDGVTAVQALFSIS